MTCGLYVSIEFPFGGQKIISVFRPPLVLRQILRQKIKAGGIRDGVTLI